MKENSESKWEIKLAALVMILGILLRFALAFFTIEGGDPCYHLSVSRFIGRNFAFPLFEPIGREIFAHEPLFHIFGGIFYFAFDKVNMGDLGIRLVSPVFGSLSLLMAFFVARKMFNGKIALYALIFTAFIPLHIYHSTTAHIDMVAAFFVLLSVYFALEKNLYGMSIAFGLSLLARINSVFILPFLLLMLFKSHKKNFAKSLLIFVLIAAAISSPWYLRNYAELHNPIWPYFNSYFDGYYSSTSHDNPKDKFGQLFHFRDGYVEVFLALFGVPDGKYSNLFLFDSIPFRILIAGWVIFSLVSLIPLLFWSFKRPFIHKNTMLVLWIAAPFIFFLYFYQFNYGNTSTRYILPAIPFIGALWGIGIENISTKINKKFIGFFLVLFIAVFSASEAIKTGIISLQWKSLDNDIRWVQENTPKDALFLVPGQCLAYRLDRYAHQAGTGYNLVPSLNPPIDEIGYIVDMEHVVQKPIPKSFIEPYMPYFKKIYENKDTKFVVYKNKIN